MAGIAGKASLIKFSTTAGGAGTYTSAVDLNQFNISINGENLDISAFAATWKSYIQGLKGAEISFGGFRNASDTTGQVAYQSALLNDSEIWIELMPDGSTGFKAQIKPGSLEVGSEVAGVVSVSGSCVATGAVTTV